MSAFLAKVIAEIINPLILLLATVSFVVFFWGIFEFVAHAGDATKREDGRRAMLWGIIGLAIIFGAYGIINIALSTFNLPLIHR